MVIGGVLFGAWSWTSSQQFAVLGALCVALPLCLLRSDALSARLVHAGLIPQSLARLRLSLALELVHLRRLRGNAETCLELEACIGDADVSRAVQALDMLPSVGEALGDNGSSGGILTLMYCRLLSDTGLQMLIRAMIGACGGTLRVLYLEGCTRFSDDIGEHLGKLLLEQATVLTDLGLIKCSITTEKLYAFSNILQASGASARSAMEAPAFSALAISEMLDRGSAPLQDVPPLPMAPSFAHPISQDLELSLCTLRLSGNQLSGAGRSLAALLRTLPKLDWLSLETCALQEDDFRQLARALPRSSVTRLDLASNSMKSKGLMALVGGIRLSNLQDLGIERNDIGVGDALYELKAVHDRRPFPTLRLSGNRLSAQQEKAFMYSLRSATAPRKRLGASYCPPRCACNYGRDHVM